MNAVMVVGCVLLHLELVVGGNPVVVIAIVQEVLVVVQPPIPYVVVLQMVLVTIGIKYNAMWVLINAMVWILDLDIVLELKEMMVLVDVGVVQTVNLGIVMVIVALQEMQ
jgi:hypothetical protein